MSETKDTPAASSVNPRMGSAAHDVLCLLQEDLQRRADMDAGLVGLAKEWQSIQDGALWKAKPNGSRSESVIQAMLGLSATSTVGLANKLRVVADLLGALPKDDLQHAALLLSALADAERLAAVERGETLN